MIEQVISGEEIIIAKGNKPVAKPVSIEQARPKRKLETAKGKFQIAPDFDAPLNDFKEYM